MVFSQVVIVVLRQQLGPEYENHSNLINHMNAANGQIFSYLLFSILALLVITLATLMTLICKHFGKLLLYEMAWLCTVQVLFQIGFLARGLGVNISNELHIKEDNMWNYKMCMWSALLPLFTELFPILVLYIQHIKHFSGHKSAQLREEEDQADHLMLLD